MTQTLLTDARAAAGQLVEWRRHLHAHPELSGEEEQTAAFVAAKLREMGYRPTERVGGSWGLTADLVVDLKAPFVALRADMDALPIDEQNDLPYRSQRPGVMHACGHDAHTAMLLGAARILSQRRSELRTNVRLIFQPHEEKFPGGAPAMIAGGALENVRCIFGIHICSNVPTGQIGTRPGPFMAAVNPFVMTVRGQGGHAAMPDQCRDPIVAAAQIITALQTIVSRNVPVAQPAVVSVTRISGGTADNVIPERVELEGTIRTFDDAVRRHVVERVRQLARQIGEALDVQVETSIREGYPALINDPQTTQAALDAARSIGFADDDLLTLDPQGGGEDFAYYCQKVPGAFVFLGARNPEKDCVWPHHHPRFNIDEAALPAGAALYAAFALGQAAR